jgi:hypothetical protein
MKDEEKRPKKNRFENLMFKMFDKCQLSEDTLAVVPECITRHRLMMTVLAICGGGIIILMTGMVLVFASIWADWLYPYSQILINSASWLSGSSLVICLISWLFPLSRDNRIHEKKEIKKMAKLNARASELETEIQEICDRHDEGEYQPAEFAKLLDAKYKELEEVMRGARTIQNMIDMKDMSTRS